jgi:hypothetical protein
VKRTSGDTCPYDHLYDDKLTCIFISLGFYASVSIIKFLVAWKRWLA